MLLTLAGLWACSASPSSQSAVPARPDRGSPVLPRSGGTPAAGAPGAPTVRPPPSPTAGTGSRVLAEGLATVIPTGWQDDSADHPDDLLAFSVPFAGELPLITIDRELADDARNGRSGSLLEAIAAGQTSDLLLTYGCPDQQLRTIARSVDGSAALSGDLECPPARLRVVITVHADYAFIIGFVDQALTFDADAAALEEVLRSWSWS